MYVLPTFHCKLASQEQHSHIEDNKREMSNSTRAMEVWVKYSDAVDAAKKCGRDPPPYPKHPVTGQVMKMAPKRTKLRQIIHM
jgi:hypothetical protein